MHASSVSSGREFRFQIFTCYALRVAFLCVLLCITYSNCSTCHSGYRGTAVIRYVIKYYMFMYLYIAVLTFGVYVYYM